MNHIQFSSPSRPIIAAGYYLDPSLKTLFLPDGRKVALTETEGRIMACLLINVKRPVSRLDLSQNAFDENEAKEGRTIDVHISRLRKKLGEYSYTLTSKYGKGYVINPPSIEE